MAGKRKDSLPTRTIGRPATDPAKRKTKGAATASKTRPLGLAQLLFVERYLVHRNAARAYRESHPDCKPSSAHGMGSRLASDPRAAKLIKAGVDRMVKQYRHSAKKTLDELALIGFSNVLDFVDEHGNVKKPQDLAREFGATIKRMEREELFAGVGKGRAQIGHTVKVELHDKVGALKALGQHYGLFVEQVVVADKGDFAALLKEARERAMR